MCGVFGAVVLGTDSYRRDWRPWRLVPCPSKNTLSATATKGLLGNVGGITSARGRIFQFRLTDETTIPVLPTFHPAALLRDPELKKPVWEDMKKLRSILG